MVSWRMYNVDSWHVVLASTMSLAGLCGGSKPRGPAHQPRLGLRQVKQVDGHQALDLSHRHHANIKACVQDVVSHGAGAVPDSDGLGPFIQTQPGRSASGLGWDRPGGCGECGWQCGLPLEQAQARSSTFNSTSSQALRALLVAQWPAGAPSGRPGLRAEPRWQAWKD